MLEKKLLVGISPPSDEMLPITNNKTVQTKKEEAEI